MSDKERLLAEADEAYRERRQAVDRLDERARGQVWLGSWGVREILIRIAGWHREMLPALGRIGRGEPPYPEGVSDDDFDGCNARFVEAQAGLKAADALDALETSHRDFIAAARTLPAVHFAEHGAARDLFLGIGPEHYREHAGQVRSWRQGEGL